MPLSIPELLKLKRWNTPTIYNGWEQITKHPRTTCFNLEEINDFMPEMGPMIGYAVTVTIEPSNPEHVKRNPDAWNELKRYIASVKGPKIMVIKDLDKPNIYGSFWGEVGATTYRALGCVGTITDGAIRDLDEMKSAGFKALAKRMCVGHAYNHPVSWGEKVTVFGTEITPGQLIHADKHGFLAIPPEDEARLLEAALFMDNNECDNMINHVIFSAGNPAEDILSAISGGAELFSKAVNEKFGNKGEW